jgi:hypothetical protein
MMLHSRSNNEGKKSGCAAPRGDKKASLQKRDENGRKHEATNPTPATGSPQSRSLSSRSNCGRAGSNREAERLSLLLPLLRALAEADVERQAGEALARLFRRKPKAGRKDF